MTTTPTVSKKAPQTTSDDTSRVVVNHRKIAVQLQAAAKLHLEAALHYAAGDLGKASEKTSMAQKHTALAQKNELADTGPTKRMSK